MRFQRQLDSLGGSCRLGPPGRNGLNHETEVDSSSVKASKWGCLSRVLPNDNADVKAFLLGPLDKTLEQGLPVLSDAIMAF